MKTGFLALLSFCVLSCNNAPKPLSADENTAGQSTVESTEVLSPDDWLAAWNEAYNECYNSLPPVEPLPQNFDPDQDIMEQAMFQPIVNRDNEVDALIREKYPELYAYRQIAEYENKLQEQNQRAYKLISELEQQNEEQKERFLKENQEWLKQFNQNILDAIDGVRYY